MTNAEARFNNSLRPRKPEGSLWRTAQDVHLDSHTAPELCFKITIPFYIKQIHTETGEGVGAFETGEGVGAFETII